MMEHKHTLHSVFVYMMMGLFVVLSMFLVLLGVQTYERSVERSEENNQRRVALNYVRSLLRAEDDGSGVTVEEVDGVQVLNVKTSVDAEDESETYTRRIYCYEGYLWENYDVSDRPFEAGDGERICEMTSFDAELQARGVMLHIVYPAENEYYLFVAIRAENDQ